MRFQRAAAGSPESGDSFRGRDGPVCSFNGQLRRAGALQGVNHRRLRRVIGGGVGATGDADGAVGRVVIRKKFLVLLAVVSSLLFVAQLGVDQRQVVVRRQIFRIQRQGFLKLLDRLPQDFLL